MRISSSSISRFGAISTCRRAFVPGQLVFGNRLRRSTSQTFAPCSHRSCSTNHCFRHLSHHATAYTTGRQSATCHKHEDHRISSPPGERNAAALPPLRLTLAASGARTRRPQPEAWRRRSVESRRSAAHEAPPPPRRRCRGTAHGVPVSACTLPARVSSGGAH